MKKYRKGLITMRHEPNPHKELISPLTQNFKTMDL